MMADYPELPGMSIGVNQLHHHQHNFAYDLDSSCGQRYAHVTRELKRTGVK